MAESGLQSPRLRESELSVRSLLVPLDGMTLIVPNALVSEVAILTEITPISGGAKWLHGTIAWRGLRVPILSFERAIGGTAGNPTRQSRAIVFNTLNNNRELPFLAVLSQRIPRLLLVTGRMLQGAKQATPQAGVLARFELQGGEVLVPDMDRLEHLLCEEGVKVERDLV
jgi:chemosensory pili system protein ChpC